MLQQIDHIVVLVYHLARAMEDYDRLGFTVTPGGEHTGGATHNALIAFGDGTYFELIAFKEPDRPQNHRWWPCLQQGEGLIDFAVLSDGVPAEAEVLRARGLDPSGPTDGGRLRPDGQRVAWRSLTLGHKADQGALPFVIEDVSPRALRVPGGGATHHRLPVQRVAGLRVVVSDLATQASAFAAYLGTEGRSMEATVAAPGDALRFDLGQQWIELVQPDDPSGKAGQYLSARGEGPFEVFLANQGSAEAAGMQLPLDATHGARIRVTG